MKINFIGNFANGYVGEIADQVHLVREMEALGHIVQRVPQDIWKAYVDGLRNNDWEDHMPMPDAQINIITKWHHFNDKKYINELRAWTNAPVLYWVWDMMADNIVAGWHLDMLSAADLYLGNDVRSPFCRGFKNAYYFPFDVADGDLPRYEPKEKTIDVAFFGSWVGKGDRQKWLTEINKTNPITVFSWNYKDWPKEFNANPPVYEVEFAKKIGQTKIVLGFSIEPNMWGYWSNRVGKTLTVGGFLLQQYAPGMELFLKDGVEYFSSIEEAREKIDHFLIAEDERMEIARRGLEIGKTNFTSKQRVKELVILVERFIKTKGKGWMI